MSDQKLCRLCLNAVFPVSTSVYLSDVGTKKILSSIFPGLNTSLTTSLRLCEECFNNVNFAHRVKEAFREKEKEFSNAYYGSFCRRPYCSLCFRFETKDVIFLHKHNYSNESFKDIIDITLSESKIINDDKNICCICWSWIKKIYSFKKRCFKMEESLKLYGLEMGLLTLTDKNLEEFVYKEYYKKSNNTLPQYSSDNNNVNTADLSNLSNLSQDKIVDLDSGLSFENDYDEIEIKYNDPTDTSQSSSIETVTNITNAEETNTDNSTFYDYDADDEFDESILRQLDNNCIVISDEEDNITELNTSLNKHKWGVVCIDLSKNNTSSMGETPIAMDLRLNIESQDQEQNALDQNAVSLGIKDSTPHVIQNTDCTGNSYKAKDNQKLYTNNNLNNNTLKNITKETTQQKKCRNSINSTNTNLQLIINDVPTEESIDLTNDNLQVLYCGTSEYSKIFKKVTSQNQQNKDDQLRSVESIFHSKNINIIPLTKNLSSDLYLVDYNQNSSRCINGMKDLPNVAEDDDECMIVNEHVEILKSQQHVENTGLLGQDEECFEVLNVSCDLKKACDILEPKTIEDRKKSADLKSYYVWGCHICVAKFADKGKVRKHMLNHEEPWNKYGRFQCKKCPFRSSWKGSVTRHKMLHTKANFIKYYGKKLKYFCPYCSNTFDAKGDIQAHINEHVVSWKNFQCGECIFSTNNSEALRTHYSRNHTKAKDPTFAPAVNWEAAYQYLTDN